jgi:hypothetical protein
MQRVGFLIGFFGLCILATGIVRAQQSDAELISDAESAALPAVTQNAMIKAMDGRMLREGSNGWTCYPGSSAGGPKCNQSQWDAVIGALNTETAIDVEEFSVSYMLAGDGESIGASNTDPFATAPSADNDWVKEGPHLMIAVPDPAVLEGLSTDPTDPVYVMWKDTPYAHIMIKIAEEQ